MNSCTDLRTLQIQDIGIDLTCVRGVDEINNYISSFSLGEGGAMIGWGGFLPFATQRPKDYICQVPINDGAGGASITALPEITLSDEDIIPEADLSATFQQQKASESTTGQNESTDVPPPLTICRIS